MILKFQLDYFKYGQNKNVKTLEDNTNNSFNNFKHYSIRLVVRIGSSHQAIKQVFRENYIKLNLNEY